MNIQSISTAISNPLDVRSISKSQVGSCGTSDGSALSLLCFSVPSNAYLLKKPYLGAISLRVHRLESYRKFLKPLTSVILFVTVIAARWYLLFYVN